MNQLQKRAALYKLAAIQGAIRYVLRQRYMRKQAEGGLDINDTQKMYEGRQYVRPYKPVVGPYSTDYFEGRPRVTDQQFAPGTLGDLTNQGLQNPQTYYPRYSPNPMVPLVETASKYMYNRSPFGYLNTIGKAIAPEKHGLGDELYFNHVVKPVRNLQNRYYDRKFKAQQQRAGRASLPSADLNLFTPNPAGQSTQGTPIDDPLYGPFDNRAKYLRFK